MPPSSVVLLGVSGDAAARALGSVLADDFRG